MNKPLLGVLATVTLLSASMYDKIGVNAVSRLASTPQVRAAASAVPMLVAVPSAGAPAAPAAPTVLPPVLASVGDAAHFALVSEQTAVAHAPAMHKAAGLPTRATLRDSWEVPTMAVPAAGINLPANYQPPLNE